MAFAFLCLCLLALLLISEPLSVSAEGRDGVRIYIRLIFFGMILSSSGHTDRKRQTTRRKRRSNKKKKRDTAVRGAVLRAVRYLLPRATLHLEYDPRIEQPRTPVEEGIRTAILSALYGILSDTLARVEALPIRAQESEHVPYARATLRASLLDVLIGAGLFASAYIKRKDNAWQKHK